MKIIFIILFIPIMSFSQGDDFILFSRTGDTLLTRTSCIGAGKDTLATYFNILKNVQGNLQLLQVFQIKEAGKNGIPCADFNKVHRDTIFKYGFFNEGVQCDVPKKFKINSEILRADTVTMANGEFMYFRQIKYSFKIRRHVFYSTVIRDLVQNKNAIVKKPKIDKVYGSSKLKKYHFIIILQNEFLDRLDGKAITHYNHTRIIY